VTLESVLRRAGPTAAANYLTLHASADNFHASVPLAAVRGEGIVVYRLDGSPLPVRNGGPIRFLIKDPAACHTDELDDCANVKFVDRIELTAGKGLDTRPETEDEHERLHWGQ
jgi:DMSO/TMAO reductase YedYZ molybdopterin-dependent catalytic subunit